MDEDRNELATAIDRMASVFGSPGKAALRLFLDSFPSDAVIVYGSGPDRSWARASVVAEELGEELAGN